MNGHTHHQNTNTIELTVEGMTCQSCANTVTRTLKNKGLSDVHVDYANNEVRFSLADTKELPIIIKSIEDVGYKVANMDDRSAETIFSSVESRFYLSLVFTLPLFFHMFLPWMWLHHPYIQLTLCIPVVILGWIHFGKSAWGSVKVGEPNMDVLIFIGFTSAFMYSFIGTIYQLGADYLFYETAATIVTLVLLGNVMEKRSVKQTSTAIKELSHMQEVKAKKIVAGGEYVEIDFKDIKVGDLLLVNTGDKIPTDGEVLKGEGTVDESMLTGESIPVEKQKGDNLIGGTVLMSGTMQVLAMNVGKNTVLSHIIELVKDAQRSKPSIQTLGDRVSAVFVPVVIAIALLTFTISYFVVDIALQKAFMNSVAVLVIACPCAMGLATPTAVMVGLGRAARNGILIKGGNTLEQFAPVKMIIFDKTGTLTTGEFRISNFELQLVPPPDSPLTVDQVKGMVRKLEEHSSHPIAKSLVKELKGSSASMELIEIKEEKGIGVSAKDHEGNSYRVGSYQVAKHLTNGIAHNVYVLKNDKLVATIDIEDELKPYAVNAIAELHKLGLKTALISGDRKTTCEEVARKLGIDEVHSEKLPHEKLTLIEHYAKNGKVAMVGDGVNDAPALTKATVGISMSNATQIAIQSAQIILLNGDLSTVTKAIAISRHTLLTIKQNLFWAFFYNIVAIPVAAVGMLNPMIAALAMAFSDVIVIGNSIRLKTKKIS